MSVLVVIPTVTGRENFLDDCLDNYGVTLGENRWRKKWDVAVVVDRSTCGEAWNRGAKLAQEKGFDYVHMTADDLIPLEGWYEAAVETLESGFLPCARVLRPDGSIEAFGDWGKESIDWDFAPGASVPFCRTKDWIDIPEIHYYSDNAFDWAQSQVNGYQFRARTNYAFTHHSAQTGRKQITSEEKEIFERWAITMTKPENTKVTTL